MIKFSATKDGKSFFGFGITDGNIEKLKEGKPIVIDMSSIGMGDGQMMIFYGPTEQDIIEELQALELISNRTEVIVNKTVCKNCGVFADDIHPEKCKNNKGHLWTKAKKEEDL